MQSLTPVASAKPSYPIKGFVSSSFVNRLDAIYALLETKVNSLISEKTEQHTNLRTSYSVDWLRLDKAAFTALSLPQNVFQGIKKCHILIADVTPEYGLQGTSTNGKANECPNPNVMHEIGYATAMGIPVFLIGDQGSSSKMPANLRGSLVAEYNQATLSDPAKQENFCSILSATIVNYIAETGMILSPPNFLIRGYKQRRHVDLENMIRSSRYRIYILTTNLDYVHSKLSEPISDALKFNLGGPSPRNASYKVDILTMDPESIVTNARARQLNVDVAEYRDSLRRSLSEMRAFEKQYSQNITVSTYITLPTMILMVVDDVAVWSVPFPSQQSRLVPHFVSSQDELTTQQLISYFFSVKSQTGGSSLL
jgi:hypothetical protein